MPSFMGNGGPEGSPERWWEQAPSAGAQGPAQAMLPDQRHPHQQPSSHDEGLDVAAFDIAFRK